MSPLYRSRRVQPFLGGFLLGAVGISLGLWTFMTTAPALQLRDTRADDLGLPSEAWHPVPVRIGAPVHFELAGISLRDASGERFAAAPRASFAFDPASLTGGGPVELTGVELRDPFLRLEKGVGGRVNLAAAFASPGRREGASGEGRAVLLRGVRVTGGRGVLALDGPLPLRRFQRLDARLSTVRFGGAGEWSARVTSLVTSVTEPALGSLTLRGEVGGRGEGGVRFDLDELRTAHSFVSGSGVVRLAGPGPRLDADLIASPLDFRDLAIFIPDLPPEGRADLSLALRTLADGRVRVDAREVVIAAPGSRVTGRFAVVAGGGRPPLFLDTRLDLAPLDLSLLALLGLDELPYQGTVRGTVSSPELREGPLRVDLVAEVTPEGEEGEPSRLTANGALGFGSGDQPLVLEELRVGFDPFYLAHLRPLAPGREELLRGELRGGVLLDGPTGRLRLSGGEVSYTVGSAAATRLVDLAGRLALGAEPDYRLRARAEPLALATLTELFPVLPFRVSTLVGPVEVSGNADRLAFESDLSGEVGALALRGGVEFADPASFDLAGTLEAFRASRLLRPDLPAEPVSGSFAAQGTTKRFGFEVDLLQGGGTFALEGSFAAVAGSPPRLAVEGSLDRFRLGTAIGRPGLFPDPLTGPFLVEGGGGAAYTFDTDLRGGRSVLDLAGFFRPGRRPEYAASGQVVGLDLSRLPGRLRLPDSEFNGTLAVRGRGDSPETFDGELRLNTRNTTIAGYELEVGMVELATREGALQIDTLQLEYRGSVLSASGGLGLTRPSPEPIRIDFSSNQIATLAPLLPVEDAELLQLSGSLQLQGWLAGTLRRPLLHAGVTGRNLRFRDFRAGALSGSVLARRLAGGWSGQADLQAERVDLPGGQTFRTAQLEAVAEPGELWVDLAAARPDGDRVALAASFDLSDGFPSQAEIESLDLTLGEARWRLSGEGSVSLTGGDLVVRRLRIERVQDGTGRVEVDGVLPSRGLADFRVRVEQLDAEQLGELIPGFPDFGGVVNLVAAIDGPADDPRFELSGSVDELEYEGASVERVALTASYADRRFEGEVTVWMGGMEAAFLEAGLPADFSLSGIAPSFRFLEEGPVRARLVADSLPVSLLAASLPGLRDGEGLARAEVAMAGTLDSPSFDGYLALQGAGFTVETLGVPYREIDGRVDFAGQEVQSDALLVRAGKGSGRLAGSVRFDQPGRPLFSVTASLQDFWAVDREGAASFELTGDLALSGRAPSPLLTGRLTLDDGTVAIPDLGSDDAVELAELEVGEIGADSIPSQVADPGVPWLAGLRVDGLEISVGDQVWLVSDDVRAQMGGGVTVFRQAGGETRVSGELVAERGTYNLTVGPIVREFEIVSGSVQFFGTPDLNPALDVTAANEIRSVAGPDAGSILTILARVTGSLQSPEVTLTSDTRPPLPESEIISYLIFGRPSFQIGDATGALAQQILLQETVGGLVATRLEQFLIQDLGLAIDYVRVRSRPSEFAFGEVFGETVVEVGKQFGNVFWTVEAGIATLFGGGTGRPTLGTAVEWQIDREWSVRFAYEPIRTTFLARVQDFDLDYQFSVDLRRRWEFGHPEEEEPRARLEQEEERGSTR